jgi:hypothetical protein
MALPAQFKTTELGTELPLLNLKGKPYLQVAHRLVWLRERYPHAKVFTEIVSCTDEKAVVRASISVPDAGAGAWLELATAHKTEYARRFPDYLEKAETGAIGRALGISGFGTQFEPEFDEEDRIVDAPVLPAQKSAAVTTPQHTAVDPRKDLKEMIPGIINSKKMTGQQFVEYLNKTFGVASLDALTEHQCIQIKSHLKSL